MNEIEEHYGSMVTNIAGELTNGVSSKRKRKRLKGLS